MRLSSNINRKLDQNSQHDLHSKKEKKKKRKRIISYRNEQEFRRKEIQTNL